MRRVMTKSELKRAVKANEPRILVVGKLANSIVKSQRIKKLSGAALAILAVSLAAVPATGGLSAVGAAPVAATTGVSTSVIVAVVAVGGIALVLAIANGYDIRVTAKDGRGRAIEVELNRKR